MLQPQAECCWQLIVEISRGLWSKQTCHCSNNNPQTCRFSNNNLGLRVSGCSLQPCWQAVRQEGRERGGRSWLGLSGERSSAGR